MTVHPASPSEDRELKQRVYAIVRNIWGVAFNREVTAIRDSIIDQAHQAIATVKKQWEKTND